MTGVLLRQIQIDQSDPVPIEIHLPLDVQLRFDLQLVPASTAAFPLQRVAAYAAIGRQRAQLNPR